jgi:repressor LexA
MRSLTARQQQVLEAIRLVIHRDGTAPTRVELAKIFGWKSPNSAEDHLRILAHKGHIKLIRGTSRGIRLTR